MRGWEGGGGGVQSIQLPTYFIANLADFISVSSFRQHLIYFRLYCVLNIAPHYFFAPPPFDNAQ